MRVPWFYSGFLVASIAIAVALGVHFGMYSCGGYRWHRQLAFATVLGLSLINLLPLPGSPRVSLRVLGCFSVLLLYALAKLLGAQFYPSAPESFAGIFVGMMNDIRFGGRCE